MDNRATQVRLYIMCIIAVIITIIIYRLWNRYVLLSDLPGVSCVS